MDRKHITRNYAFHTVFEWNKDSCISPCVEQRGHIRANSRWNNFASVGPVLDSIAKPISGYCPAEICDCNEPWSKIVGMSRGQSPA
jgi:hypothetical protein